MLYSNDEADKAERRKSFYLTVYGWPILVEAVLVGALYWAYSSGYLDGTDFTYGCLLSLTPAVLVYGLNRRHWLKMPDGTYHNIKGEPLTPTLNRNEPGVYEAEYYYSKKEKATSLVMGVLLIGISCWLYITGTKSVLIPVVTVLSGLFLVYVGLKGILDKSAQLKIAANGLWTKKLGFVNWDDINYADVTIDKSGREPQTYLEIRLKGTKYEAANQPDERLLLSDLQNKNDVELVINQSINKYNQQKSAMVGDR